MHGLFSLALILPSVAVADAPSVDGGASQVVVNVRVVRAVMNPANEVMSRAEVRQHIEGELRDIAPKLSKLRYNNFKLVCKQQEQIPVMKKRTVYLNDGNTLTVRPLYADGNKVGLWLRWLDGSGARILDTRMHFTAGESLLTGTDIEKEVGLVLAIEVHPVHETVN